MIGFFTNATGHERLDDEWWRRWLLALRAQRPQARLSQILPPGMRGQALVDGVRRVCICELDVLAASGTPVVGLFKVASATAYVPKGLNCTTLNGHALPPENAARETLKRVRQTFATAIDPLSSVAP